MFISTILSVSLLALAFISSTEASRHHHKEQHRAHHRHSRQRNVAAPAHHRSRKHTPPPQNTTRTASSGGYSLTQEYTGKTFFDGWTFFTDPDPTHGQVNFLSDSAAKSAGLAYVNSAGNAVMAVDSKTDLSPGQNRNSVRITSNKVWNKGLLIIDAVKMPFGCGVWPAFWTVGTNWPSNGEIDIIENVHNAVQDQSTLHTRAGCTLQTPMKASGSALSNTCDATVNGNQGCGVKIGSTNSYGSAFNAVGGGVYATQWQASGISIWFFQRSQIPSDIINKAPNPAGWGQPVAFWAASSCGGSDISNFFGPQNIVFDITLCGDWAGNTFGQSGCSGTCSDRVQKGANFATAQWEVKSVRVYQ